MQHVYAVLVDNVVVDGAPPLKAGAVQFRVTKPLPGTATNPVGAFGTVYGTAVTAKDPIPAPAALCAETENS